MEPLTEGKTTAMDFMDKVHVFRGKALWARETLTVDKDYVVYKKRSSLFSPLFSVTVPKLSISSIDIKKTLSGFSLQITTFSNNNIFSGNFSKRNINKFKSLVGK
ncbi:MAG TPA: hypothetical protein ENN08_02135 [Bacteroidales bacterium]|nr:hypothetical protein [Bacteroidales bacterium]